MIIGISGVDGSGKTTLAKGLTENLKNDSMYLHWPSLINKRKTGKIITKVIKKRVLTQIFRLLIFLRGYLIVSANYIIHRNKLVIVDRTVYDELIHLKYHHVINKSIFQFLQKILKKPDITFIIDIDSQIAFDRKKEETKTEIEGKVKLYNSLKENSIIRLDGRKNKQVLLNKILNILRDKKYIKTG